MSNTFKDEEKNISKIIDALVEKEDEKALEVLERVGTNCSIDEVRRMTAKALVKKNTPESLAIVIGKKGKGINDLSTSVAMSTINELLSLEDKENAVKVLSDVQESAQEEEIRGTAGSVKTLMEYA